MLFAEEELPLEAVVVVIAALFVGALCGLWPLAAGARKGRPGLGATGFFACLGSGFFLGCLLAFPTAVLFRVLIGLLDHPAPPGGDGLGGRPFNPYADGKRSAF